jgi:hypothetical protein
MSDLDTYVSRRRPNPVNDGLAGASTWRVSGYGDQVQYQSQRNALVDEGSYYGVCNPTIDTTVGYGVITAYVVTTPAFHIANTDVPSAAGARTIFLDFLKLRVTVAPASATNWKYVVDIDSSPRISTAPTGGAELTVKNFNPLIGNDFPGRVWAFTGGTVLTVMAANNVRTVAHGAWANSIPIVLDEMVLKFGQGEGDANAVTTVGRRVASAPPIAIPPGCSASIHMYGTSNAITGMSAEYSLGMWAR